MAGTVQLDDRGVIVECTACGKKNRLAYERLGDVVDAEAMLAAQLEHVRGTRRIELQKRLAVLRQDQLNDLEGALALLEEIATVDVSDAEVRRRLRDVAIERELGDLALAGSGGWLHVRLVYSRYNRNPAPATIRNVPERGSTK